MGKVWRKVISGFFVFIMFCNLNTMVHAGAVYPIKNMNEDYYQYSVIYEYIKQLDKIDFLSEEEKNTIREETKVTRPHYNKITIWENKVKKIKDKIMKKAKPFNQKYDALYSANIKLWTALDEEFKEMNSGKKYSKVQLLELSKILTEEDKKLLKEVAKELDTLDSEIIKIQKRADKATNKLNKLIEQEYGELEKIYEKTAPIWEIIFKNVKLK